MIGRGQYQVGLIDDYLREDDPTFIELADAETHAILTSHMKHNRAIGIWSTDGELLAVAVNGELFSK